MRLLKPVMFAALATLALYACKKDDSDERDPCLQPTIMNLKAVSVRRADTGTATIDTSLPFPIARPLSDQPTQYIVTFGSRRREFLLPLSQVADSCRWSLQPDSVGLIDTLTFHYTRQLRFLSNACGYTTFYNLSRVATTRHAIDSVILSNASVTTDAAITNLRIYY